MRDEKHVLIVGLGNPGAKYEGTKHNAGFEVLDRLSHTFSVPLNGKKFNGYYGNASVAGYKVHLLKPLTYMNKSGQSVVAASEFFKIPVENIWVIHDELDLALGDVRIKSGGGHGGHNGLRSVINLRGSNKFLRFRVGIARPNHADVVNYVLTPFNLAQRDLFDEALDLTAQVVQMALKEGTTASMNYCNGLFKAKVKKEEAKGE